MNDQQITEVDCQKHLGLRLSNDTSWHTHINSILVKVSKGAKIRSRYNQVPHPTRQDKPRQE